MADENTSKALRESRSEPLKEIQRLRDLVTKENRDFTAEEQGAWDKANKEYDSLSKRIEIAERAEKLEGEQTRAATDNKPIGREDFDGDPEKQADPTENRADKPKPEDYSLALNAWLRSQCDIEASNKEREACKRLRFDPMRREIRGDYLDNKLVKKLQQIKRTSRSGDEYEQRAQSAVIGAGGAFTVGSSMAAAVEMATLAYGGMMEVADVFSTTGGEPFTFPSFNDTSNTGAQISENTQVSEQTITFAGLTLNAHKFTSYSILVPTELLEDSAYDVSGFVSSALGERIARIVNTKTTTGVGGTTPYGIVPASTVGKTTASATAITADEIIDLVHSVDPSYRSRPGAGFMFHDNILAVVRKLKDGMSQYLWQPGIGSGVPDRLFNYPYTINQDMQSSVATGTRTIIFGWLQAYKIRRVGNVRFYRMTERYRDYDQDGFVAFARYDGGLLDAGTHPVKCMAQA